MKLKKFYSFSPDSSSNAVKKFEKRLCRKGMKKVMKAKKCHFYLVFCPIVSRVKTDITSALEAVPVDKKVILVVLHHTFDKDYSVPNSSGHAATVTKPGQEVILTVNCLFHETKGLLDCSRNDHAIKEIIRKKHELKGKSNPPDGPAGEPQATGERTVQGDPDESKGGKKEKKMRKFYSFSPDSSSNAVKKFEKRLCNKGLKKVMKAKKCHFYLVFCPIVSRVQTDITSAMEAVPVDKRVILVVLHHTFDKDYSVPNSSGLVATVTKPGQEIILTVNCLFHETKGLLDCSRNDHAIKEIMSDGLIDGRKKLGKIFRKKK